MCLILFAYQCHPAYRLVFAANRDEFYQRPTAPMHFWEDAPGVLAGKDLEAGGTWMGITVTGRFAAVTNFREPDSGPADPLSRGELVADFLMGEKTPLSYLTAVKEKRHRYKGFNLIAGDAASLYHYSNRHPKIQEIPPGVHGLSNHLLNTPWPKVQKGRDGLENMLQGTRRVAPEQAFELLSDRTAAPPDRLPDTGVGQRLERILSPLFIVSPGYGTRSSTVLLWEPTGRVTVVERTFTIAHNRLTGHQDRQFELNNR